MNNCKFEKLVCNKVVKFINENFDKVRSFYTINNKEEFINSIKDDFQSACWCLCQFINWGMNIDENPFIIGDNFYEPIYRIKSGLKSIYFTINENYDNKTNTITYSYTFKKKTKKISWEDAE